MSLQDDTAQILDVSKGIFLNLVGHKSFVSQAVMADNNTALLASFDGTISLTMLPPLQEWNAMSKRDRTLYTLKANTKDCQVAERFEVGRRETGVGNMLIHQNYMLLSLLDNCIKVYRITNTNKE